MFGDGSGVRELTQLLATDSWVHSRETAVRLLGRYAGRQSQVLLRSTALGDRDPTSAALRPKPLFARTASAAPTRTSVTSLDQPACR